MLKPNFPKTIIALTILIAFILIAGLFIYRCFKVKEKGNFPAEPIKPTENAQTLKPAETLKPTDSEPIEPAELETYKSELFVQAKWGKGRGEVGMLYDPEEASGDVGPNYGPQSFDVDEATGHLFLMDSINERMIEYDENGKYIRDFSIGIGATTDMKIKDNYIYILSFGSDAVYKLDMSGKILETYLIASGENPGIGTGGIEFDENGNIMVSTNIKGYYNRETRFYQASPNGDKWKTNSYKGNISRDKTGFYFARGSDWYTSKIQKVDKEGNVQKEFMVKLKERAYVYYYGCDDKENVYFDVAYEHRSVSDDDSYLDHFIFKYNKDGGLLAEVDRSAPLQELFKKPKAEILANYETNGYYTEEYRKIRITGNGDIYWLTALKGKGAVIFKYSKMINYSRDEFEKAEEVLSKFFSLLNNKNYKEAVKFYDGEYELLREYNPYENPNDYSILLKSWCEDNGGNCLQHRIIDRMVVSSDVFKFTVEFFNEDSSIFAVFPPWPLEGEGISIFSYTVKKNNDDYKVIELPPYAP